MPLHQSLTSPRQRTKERSEERERKKPCPYNYGLSPHQRHAHSPRADNAGRIGLLVGVCLRLCACMYIYVRKGNIAAHNQRNWWPAKREREREREDLRGPAPRPNCVLSSRPSGLVKIKVTRACAGLLFAPSLFFVYQMQMRARA